MDIALLGYKGYWGSKLYRVFGQVADKVLGLDPVAHNLPLKFKSYEDYALEVMRQSDAIVIATPPETHYNLVKAALLLDKHVLVEKPFVLNYDESLELCDLAAQKELVLMADHTYVYSPAVQKMREIVRSGILGKIRYIDSVRINLGIFQEVNVIYDLAPHDLSILIYLFGANKINSVQVQSYCTLGKVWDTAHLFLDHDEIACVHLHVSWCSPVKMRRFIIVGSEKMLVYDDLEEDFKIQLYDRGIVKEGDIVKHRSGDVYIPKLNFEEPLITMAKHFLSCCNFSSECKTGGYESSEIVKVINASMASIGKKGEKLWV